ncbi:phosphoglycerate dehydrogenase [Kordiimonas aestuarii]|uniref:phosphoglycerate dehydrogenase n=1 Tax=Kordiimonas aestuarii TaxID=1005925 RepID=UPI0021D12AF4|nr:phosphoglycerate dehydrogenase [Kordiimonas aestuarii]
MTSVAVCSRSFSAHPVLRAELLARYPDTRFNDEGASLSGDELIDFIGNAEKAVVALEVLNAQIIARLPKLKVVGKYGVGLDKIDLHALADAGIRLGWTPGVNRRSVAELVISLAIAMLRQIPYATSEIKAGRWRQHSGRLLSGQTVGVVGCGNVGKDLIKLLQPFGCRILVNDIAERREFCQEHDAREVSLAQLVEQADIISLHVPLNDTTRNLFSRDVLETMKSSSILINTARGGIVDEQALLEVLEKNPLRAAAFDVFASEPMYDDRFLSLPNFVATPHIGGSSVEAVLAMGRAAINGLDSAIDAVNFIE